jgi:hypothetical protein
MPRCTAVLRTVASYSVMALMGHGLGDMGERNCGLTGLGRRREVLIKPMLLWNMWYLLSMISIFAAWMYRHLAVHGGGSCATVLNTGFRRLPGLFHFPRQGGQRAALSTSRRRFKDLSSVSPTASPSAFPSRVSRVAVRLHRECTNAAPKCHMVQPSAPLAPTLTYCRFCNCCAPDPT